MGPQFPHQAQTVFARQHQVKYDGIGHVLGEGPSHGGPITNGFHDQSINGKVFGKQVPQGRIVVDNQDTVRIEAIHFLSISRALPPSQGPKCTDTNGNDRTRSGHGLDTQVCKNAFTDKRIGKGAVSTRCRYPIVLLLATLAVPLWAQQTEGDPEVSNETIHPLNLSIPRYAMGSAAVGSQPSGTLDPQRHLADLPDLGTRSGGAGSGQSGRLP